jgi:hypothetical protein
VFLYKFIYLFLPVFTLSLPLAFFVDTMAIQGSKFHHTSLFGFHRFNEQNGDKTAPPLIL